MLKRQSLEDAKSDETKLKVLKCQHVSIYDNEEKQSFDKNKSESKDKYIGCTPLLFIVPLYPPQKKSNRLTNLSEGIKNLNYLIYILKIG